MWLNSDKSVGGKMVLIEIPPFCQHGQFIWEQLSAAVSYRRHHEHRLRQTLPSKEVGSGGGSPRNTSKTKIRVCCVSASRVLAVSVYLRHRNVLRVRKKIDGPDDSVDRGTDSISPLLGGLPLNVALSRGNPPWKMPIYKKKKRRLLNISIFVWYVLTRKIIFIISLSRMAKSGSTLEGTLASPKLV